MYYRRHKIHVCKHIDDGLVKPPWSIIPPTLVDQHGFQPMTLCEKQSKQLSCTTRLS